MSTAAAPPIRQTLDDLLRTEGKAELIGGRIVQYMATGYRPNLVAGRLYRRLSDFADAQGGSVGTDGLGFAVPELPSGRESFSPDASYFTGPWPDNPMRFVEGTPDFAVEVRSENACGPAAEPEMSAKRADYFQAGTKVVGDVDPEANAVRVYRRTAPLQPTVYQNGDEAEAEPVVPGWRVSVSWLMA